MKATQGPRLPIRRTDLSSPPIIIDRCLAIVGGYRPAELIEIVINLARKGPSRSGCGSMVRSKGVQWPRGHTKPHNSTEYFISHVPISPCPDLAMSRFRNVPISPCPDHISPKMKRGVLQEGAPQPASAATAKVDRGKTILSRTIT